MKLKKITLIWLSIGLGLAGTAAIVAPVIILMQNQKAQVSAKKDVDRVEETQAFKDFKNELRKIGGNQAELQAKIDTKQNEWAKWILPFNSESVEVPQSINKIESVSINPFGSSGIEFQISFAIDWNSDFIVTTGLQDFVSFSLSNVPHQQTFAWTDIDNTKATIQTIVDDENNLFTEANQLQNYLNTTGDGGANQVMMGLVGTGKEQIQTLRFSVEKTGDTYSVESTIVPKNGYVVTTNLATIEDIILNTKVDFVWTDMDAIRQTIYLSSISGEINTPEKLAAFLNDESINGFNSNIKTYFTVNGVQGSTSDVFESITFEVPTALNPDNKYTAKPTVILNLGYGFGDKLTDLTELSIDLAGFYDWNGATDTDPTKVVREQLQTELLENERVTDLNSLQVWIDDNKDYMSDLITDPTAAIEVDENNVKDVTYTVEKLGTPAEGEKQLYIINVEPSIKEDYTKNPIPLAPIAGIHLNQLFKIDLKEDATKKLETLIKNEEKNVYDKITLEGFLNSERFTVEDYYEISPDVEAAVADWDSVIENVTFTVTQIGNSNYYDVFVTFTAKKGYVIGTLPDLLTITINKLVEVSFTNGDNTAATTLTYINNEIKAKNITSKTQFDTYFNSETNKNELLLKLGITDEIYKATYESISFELVLDEESNQLKINFETKPGFTDVNSSSTSPKTLILDGVILNTIVEIDWKIDAEKIIEDHIFTTTIKSADELQAAIDHETTGTAFKTALLQAVDATYKDGDTVASDQIDIEKTTFAIEQTSTENSNPVVVTLTPTILWKSGYGLAEGGTELIPLENINLNTTTTINWINSIDNTMQNLVFNANIQTVASLETYLASPEFKNLEKTLYTTSKANSVASISYVVSQTSNEGITPIIVSITPTVTFESGFILSGNTLPSIIKLKLSTGVTLSWNNENAVRKSVQDVINASSSSANEAERIDNNEKLKSKLDSSSELKNSIQAAILLNNSNTNVSSITFAVDTNSNITVTAILSSGYEPNNSLQITGLNLVRKINADINSNGIKDAIQNIITTNEIKSDTELEASINSGAIHTLIRSRVSLLHEGINLIESATIETKLELEEASNTYKITITLKANPGFVFSDDSVTTTTIEGLTLFPTPVK